MTSTHLQKKIISRPAVGVRPPEMISRSST